MADLANYRVTIEKAKLENIIRVSPGKAINLVDALAFEGQSYTVRSFGTSVSAPGDPPGVDTGALRASIHVEVLSTYKRGIATGVEYALPLELGTSKMAARPFMLPMSLHLQRQVVPFWRQFID